MLRRTPTSTLFPYTTLFRSKSHYATSSALITLCSDRLGRQTWSDPYVDKAYANNSSFELVSICQTSAKWPGGDRKSTRLNSSHRCISYAVFCLKKKKKNTNN